MTESPSYKVEKKDGNFEVREYDDYILAQVDVEASYRNALGKGFSILANYIFGGNKKKSKLPMTTPVAGVNVSGSEKIPMTVPVTEESVSGSEKIPMTVPVTEEKAGKEIYRISFTMPSKYTLETLPEPDDSRIKFKEEKNQRMAVVKFSGRAKEELSIEKIDELKSWLDENGIKSRSNFIVAQYNHPMVPGFLRKNEIIVKI
ncbi:MAG TPA: heme-binding protein [Methanobacteriaceae archaeon]|nr:heme-binding protein [Methanobacteriaceae archaeon]